MKLIDADKLLEALGVFKDKEHGDPHFLNGIETAGIEQDRYTGRQCICFHGPDGVEIEVLEG